MSILTKTLSTLAVTLALGGTSIGTVSAMPVPTLIGPPTDVQTVQWHHGSDGDGWYRGHRGYRGYRPGYRRHGDYWYPLAAFGAGALIGGAIAAPSAPRYGSRHVEWCSARYRSYDASTDTYVPRAGTTARCVSPY
jgi:hypothetical protein